MGCEVSQPQQKLHKFSSGGVAIEVRRWKLLVPYLFLFAMSCNCEDIARERRLRFRVVEMNDRAIVFD